MSRSELRFKLFECYPSTRTSHQNDRTNRLNIEAVYRSYCFGCLNTDKAPTTNHVELRLCKMGTAIFIKLKVSDVCIKQLNQRTQNQSTNLCLCSTPNFVCGGVGECTAGLLYTHRQMDQTPNEASCRRFAVGFKRLRCRKLPIRHGLGRPPHLAVGRV